MFCKGKKYSMTAKIKYSQKKGFAPLEKTTDRIGGEIFYGVDNDIMPPSAHTVRERNSLTGFTLVEMLVSMAIFVIIMGMVYTIFSGTMNYWKRGYDLTSRQQASRTLISRMTNNISSLFLDTSRNIYCFGSQEKFSFISTSVKSPEGDLAEMSYEFLASDNTIVFSYQGKADFNFDTYDSSSIIAIKILELDFSYLDRGGSWLESWDSRAGGPQEGISPKAIKISFAIENLDYPENKEVFETVIELPISSKY